MIATHLARIQENAKNGRFWFVVLMDRLTIGFELISFINANNRFKVLGVELNFYRHGDLELSSRIFMGLIELWKLSRRGRLLRQVVDGMPRVSCKRRRRSFRRKPSINSAD